jgi:competence protein ComEA
MIRRLSLILLIVGLGLCMGMGPALAGDQAPQKPGAKGAVKINKFKDGKLNLNAASKEDLVKIPGISPELADSILQQRKENGEFVDIQELLDIEGVDNKLLRQLKKKIYLEPASNCNC